MKKDSELEIKILDIDSKDEEIKKMEAMLNKKAVDININKNKEKNKLIKSANNKSIIKNNVKNSTNNDKSDLNK
jgi:hypothetical protein